jgi:hypothetical protein
MRITFAVAATLIAGALGIAAASRVLAARRKQGASGEANA